ncbi:MAG: cation-translocating P-type ATPase, partial [Firmicutes bacterium]|nr:cation-translocating P-type ATPase [Bacillota bacterium]
MQKQRATTKNTITLPNLSRLTPDIETGLLAKDVHQRVEAGAINTQGRSLTPSYGRIIRKNTLTLFNIIHLLLTAAILWAGYPWPAGYVRNILFLGIAIFSSAMGIFQEVRSKRTLDKLSVLTQAKVHVMRDGRRRTVAPEELVLDDIVCLSAGDQICADAVVVEAGGLETDESLLTGEAERIKKAAGDQVLSGSYVAGGQAHVRVTAVGADNYATA